MLFGVKFLKLFETMETFWMFFGLLNSLHFFCYVSKISDNFRYFIFQASSGLNFVLSTKILQRMSSVIWTRHYRRWKRVTNLLKNIYSNQFDNALYIEEALNVKMAECFMKHYLKRVDVEQLLMSDSSKETLKSHHCMFYSEECYDKNIKHISSLYEGWRSLMIFKLVSLE